MALELSRLIKNLAQLRHKETNKNKFLKSKAKVQEYKQNVEKATGEAMAIHDYVNKGEVSPTFPIGNNGRALNPPVPMEKKSFSFLVDDILELNSLTPGSSLHVNKKRQIESDLEVGIVTNIAGVRYLSTRGRAKQLDRPFDEMNDKQAIALSKTTGRGKLK